jgi:hypothetical protein
LEKQDFESLYHETLLNPLEKSGFSIKGRSAFLEKGKVQIALIRGGGRFTSEGSISYILAFRHSFLRCKDEKKSAKQPLTAENYPWIFEPSEVVIPRTHWSFEPNKLMNLPFERLSFISRNAHDIELTLAGIMSGILDNFIPWAESVSLQEALKQMRSFSNEWWVAKLWAEDYQAADNQQSLCT